MYIILYKCVYVIYKYVLVCLNFFQIESARAVGEQVSETKSMANAVAPRERLADSEVGKEAYVCHLMLM